MKKWLFLTMLCLGLASTVQSDIDRILFEWWQGNEADMPANLSNLQTVYDYTAGLPRNVEYLTSFQTINYDGDRNFWIGQMTGWLIAPVTGEYTFRITSDDQSRVWLSPDGNPANKTLICYHDDWANYTEWTKFTTQKSSPVFLTKGKLYWLEGLWRDGTGGGFLRVAWEGPEPIGKAAATTDLENMIIPNSCMLYLNSMTESTIGVENPAPARDQSNVGVGVQTLSWDPVGTGIAQYKVYFGEDPNLQEEDLLGTVTEPQINSPALVADRIYYWRVDAAASDPNTAVGDIWWFYTEIWGPKITQQPQDLNIGFDCTGTFTIAAESTMPGFGGTITYQWFKVVGQRDSELLNGQTDDVPVGTGASYTTGTRGDYYCVVSNDSASVDSSLVRLRINAFQMQNQDIGSPSAAGSASITENGVITVTGNGSDIWGPADQFHFAYRQFYGDIDLRAKVVSMSGGSNEWRKFGVMIRDQLTPASIHAVMVATAAQGPAWAGRFATDSDNNGNRNLGDPDWNNNTPYWVRLTRNAVTNEFQGYWSYDGINWTLMTGNDEIASPQVFAMSDPIYIGLAVTAHDAGVLTTATFSDATVNGRPLFEAPWTPDEVVFSPIDSNGWLNYNATQITLTWDKTPYAPCDVTYDIYMAQDRSKVEDPESGLQPVASGLTGLSATIANAGVLNLAHDQTWYYRIAATSAAGNGTQDGFVFAINTVKAVPEISTQPQRLTVVDTPASLTLKCVATALNDDTVALQSYVWKRVIGEKDTDSSGDDQEVYTSNSPIEIERNGKRWYDCPVTLSINDVTQEGKYYCIPINSSGIAISENASVMIKREVLYYSFDEMMGNTVPDLSDSGFDGTMVSIGGEDAEIVYGGLQTGIAGKAIYLTGMADPNAACVNSGATAYDLGIEGANPKTFSVWVKNQAGDDGGVFSIGTYGKAEQVVGLRTVAGTGNVWMVDAWGNGNRTFTVTPSFMTWTHLVLTYDGQRIKIFVNGQKIDDYALTFNLQNEQPFGVGVWARTGYGHGISPVFTGWVDEVRVFNYALSPSAVANLYVSLAGGSICAEAPTYDFTEDCIVNLEDFAVFAAAWMNSSLVTP
ncbi:MAG: LamG-like jellyroll fold domain-containing protein [Anaerohalosphaeraceae bacterium]